MPVQEGLVGTLKGAPRWWRGHDAKVMQLAKEEAATAVEPPDFAWQLGEWDAPGKAYVQGLWKRRSEVRF
jgi:hypothetical protein